MSAFPFSPIGLELGAGESASADVYFSPFPPVGAHIGIWDGDGVGPGPNGPGGSPPLGLADLLGGDDVDAWDMRLPPFGGAPAYFSLDPASAGATLVAPGDVLFSPVIPGYAGAGIPAIYAAAGMLGLVAGDDIDALVTIENDGLPGIFHAGCGRHHLFTRAGLTDTRHLRNIGG